MFARTDPRSHVFYHATGESAVSSAVLTADASAEAPTQQNRPGFRAPFRCRPVAKLDDAELLARVRAGHTEDYGVLFERHHTAARAHARQLTTSSLEADDLVAEAFAKTLKIIYGGGGPTRSFRAYLFTALRHIAYTETRRARRLVLTDSVEATAIDGDVPHVITQPFQDTPVARLERTLAALAFARLPCRWQEVLWRTEIRGLTTASVAAGMHMSPNAVSALAYRAREGLRQAYLQAHVAEDARRSDACRLSIERLGAWTRGALNKRETTQVDDHLANWRHCRAVATELRHELPA
ncbi:RNA polymerase sigma factor [Amycolatopsis sp. NPDC098790]|uniref:RNA polymerase sigma factor n=1 Tax=Amycolatopsis sp. NPDC098790 TaxID=3363939 RepID=UPI0037FCB322